MEYYKKLEKKFQEKVNQFINKLPKLDNNWILVAVSEAGRNIANIISQKYNIKVQRFFIEPVHCEYNPDCEIAIIDEFGNIEVNKLLQMSFEIDDETIKRNADLIFNYKIKPMIEKERGNLEKQFIISDEVQNILIIDDNIETGFKLENIIHTFKNLFPQKKIYLGVMNVPDYIFSILNHKIEKIFCYENKYILN